jgi:gliding motility-associated-like protein
MPINQNTTGAFNMPSLDQNTTYYVEIQEGNCLSQRVPVMIKVIDETRISVPNAFSPNSDGIHDTWGINVLGMLKLSYLKVFNRWGQVVFETKDPARRWDGSLNGNPLPVGTYYWILQGTDLYGKPIIQKGPVLIVR